MKVIGLAVILAFAPRGSAVGLDLRPTSVAAGGDVVYAGTEGGGLWRSTDGGVRFAAVPEVVCPHGTIRDVSIPRDTPDGARVYAGCEDLRVAWAFEEGAWRRLFSGAPAYSDVCPSGDNGPGRPLVQEDPLNDERPTRLTGRLNCGFIDCDPYQTIETSTSFVSSADLYPAWCPFLASRLLAPFSPRSPFAVWTVSSPAGVAVFRGLARNRVTGYPAPAFYGNKNLERIGTIPEQQATQIARGYDRPERLLVSGSHVVWRSEDEGRSWQLVVPGSFAAVDVDPLDSNLVVAARGGDVLSSTDGGATWSVAFTAATAVVALTRDAADPTRVLVATEAREVVSFRLLFVLSAPEGRPGLWPARFDAESGAIEVRYVGRTAEASSYRLERRALGEPSWASVVTAPAGPRGAGVLRDGAPPPDVELGYRVVAVGAGGAEAASAPVFGVAPSTEPLAPDELTATAEPDGARRLSWRDRSGREDGYLVEFFAQDYTWRPLVLLPPNTSSYRLEPSTAGFFRVRARNGRAASEVLSAVSAGGRVPGRPPDLAGVLRAGPAAEVTVTADPDALWVVLERAVDDGPFAQVARLVLGTGVGRHSATFRDGDLAAEHNVLYRAHGANPAGDGPTSAPLSLGTWSVPPEAPLLERVVYDPGPGETFHPRLSVSWKDRSGREDGFRVLVRGLLQVATSMLGVLPRDATGFSVECRFPPERSYFFTPSRYGDQLVTVEAFDSAGGASSQPVRLRLWPADESGPLAPYSDPWVPHLLAPVVERTDAGGVEWTTEVTDVETSADVFPENYYRILDAESDVLLAGLFPTSTRGRENRVFPNAFEEVRRQHPLLPRGPSHEGAMYRRISPWVGSPSLVRVTAPVAREAFAGRAGFAYSSVPIAGLGAGPLLVVGLVESESERSDLGLVHPGGDPNPITLRVTVVDGETGAARALPDVALQRGGTRTLRSVLAAGPGAAIGHGYAIVERVDGGGTFHAYGIVLDREVPEGRYVTPSAVIPRAYESLPAVVESGAYDSEVVLTNAGDASVDLLLDYRESRPDDRSLAPLSLSLAAREQKTIPSFLEFLRAAGLSLGRRGDATRVGTLRIRRADGAPLERLHAGVHVSTVDRRFGLFIGAVPAGRGTEGLVNRIDGLGRTRVWRLHENEGERANAAVANLSDAPVRVRAEIVKCPENPDYACVDSLREVVDARLLVLPPGGWYQLDRPLATFGIRRGSVDFVRLEGAGPLYAYGVVVDDDTGDGSLFEGAGPSR